MNGFVSYCHDDYDTFREFLPYLRVIERVFAIRFWSDQRINAGYQWRAEIRNEISNSKVFILLLSNFFAASEYIWHEELPIIHKRKKVDAALVIPVVLERCAWQWMCDELQAVPTHEARIKPIADWRRRRDGLDRARQQIADSLQSYFGCTPNTFDWSVS